MQISVTFRHMEPNQSIKEYAEQKVSRVKKYIDNPLVANVILSKEKHRHIVDVSVKANGYTIVGQEETGDVLSAIDLVMNKIERQIRKRKGKITNHKSGGGAFFMESEMKDEEEMESPQIQKSTQMILKPMSIDEAIMEIDALKQDILIFSDPESKMVNVIRRLKDGSFEIFETIPE